MYVRKIRSYQAILRSRAKKVYDLFAARVKNEN